MRKEVKRRKKKKRENTRTEATSPDKMRSEAVMGRFKSQRKIFLKNIIKKKKD